MPRHNKFDIRSRFVMIVKRCSNKIVHSFAALHVAIVESFMNAAFNSKFWIFHLAEKEIGLCKIFDGFTSMKSNSELGFSSFFPIRNDACGSSFPWRDLSMEACNGRSRINKFLAGFKAFLISNRGLRLPFYKFVVIVSSRRSLCSLFYAWSSVFEN